MSSVCSAVQTIKSGDGSKTQFSFDFPYVFKSEIHVYFWNVTTKEYDEILTTDSTYPWQVPSANPTIVEFTGTAPPAPSDATANIKIRRITNIDDIQALFNPGSAIRSDDLNSNFEQLRFAVQESLCPDITEAEVVTYLQNYYWNNFEDTVTSTDTWDSSDTKIATTAAMDARFQDELSETITSTETWPNDDNTIATTAAIDDQIDNAITNDILIESNGLTKSTSGGQTTLGIGAGAVDLDRIKSDDIVETSAYSSTWTSEDDKIVTAGALAARHDVVVNTDVNPPTTTQTGKQWLSTAPGNQVHKIYDGSGWRTVAVGQPFSPATTTVVRYVDVTNGSDASDVTGFLPQAPLQSIGRALELINASSSGDGSLIKVAPGVYQETLPLRIKKNNISIVGESMRSCFVHPTVATENNDMFEVDSGSYIANLTLLGLKVPTADQGSRNNSLDNDATYGLPSNQPFSVRFRTDVQPVILKSPYIQNCTHFSDAHFDNANFDPNTFPSTDGQTYSAVAGDQTSAPCGGGLLVDGSAVSSSSPIRSMVVDAFTQITLDGPGVLVTNNGYAQLVSFFGTFAHYHAKAKNGGQINLSNCVSDFGRYGLIADGKSPSAIATATANAASSGATTITIGAITTAGSFHGTVSRPLDHMMVTIDGVDYGVVSSTANGAGWDIVLTSGLTSNITNTTVSFALRSYISTGGHTFEFVGVGTDYSDHPDNGGVPIEANQVIELNGGKVWQSSTDHVGKFKAGDVLVVDQVSETVDLKDTTVTGNITVTGTVDGRDVATDGTKLDGIAAGAEVNVNADWNATSGDAQILNKPTIPSGNIVDDTTPQLGGNLDVNGNDIVSVSNGDIDLDPNGSGVVVFKGNSTKGSGQFKLNCEQNSHGITIKGPPHSAAASYTLTLPNTDGNANEVLQTDGSGALSWVAQSGGGGASEINDLSDGTTAHTENVGLGTNALSSLQSGGQENTALGYGAGASITTNDNGTFIGSSAGEYATGSSNTAIGRRALVGVSGATTSSGNTAVGSEALRAITTGAINTAVGVDAVYNLTTGIYNTGVGYRALGRITTGSSNVGIGRYACRGSSSSSSSNCIGIGDLSLYNVTGSNNLSIGNNSSQNLTTGSRNVVMGNYAAYYTTTGTYNVALGDQAMHGQSGAMSQYNVCVGERSGYALTTGGNRNVLIGSQAGKTINSGYDNVVIGERAGESITSGNNLTVIGHSAQASSATASNEITLGDSNVQSLRIPGLQSGATDGQVLTYNATAGNITLASAGGGGGTSIVSTDNLKSNIGGELNSLTTGNSNIALGYNAGNTLTTTGNTINIGNSAGYGNTAAENIFIGQAAGYSSVGSSTGDRIGIGASAIRSVTTGYSLVALGPTAGYSLTTGRNSVLVGHGSGYNVTTGRNNVYVGHQTGYNQTLSNFNVAVGDSALYGSGTGASGNNVSIGYYSGYSNTTGSNNVFLGATSGYSITTGGSNVFVGYNTGYSTTTQSNITLIGDEAGYNVSSDDVTAVGQGAGRNSGGTCTWVGVQAGYNATGSANTGVGSSALRNATGGDNVAFGRNTGNAVTSGTYNTFIGALCGQNVTTGSQNICIGYGTEASSATVSNEITLGNSNITSLRIPGLQSGATDGQVLTYNSTNGNITLATAGGGASEINDLSDAVTNSGGATLGLGQGALANDDGTANYNVAVGNDALNSNTTGSQNNAHGYQALRSCTSGAINNAFGHQALFSTTSGFHNNAIGFKALYSNTAGIRNVANGYGALYSTTGSHNTAIGYLAGYTTTSSGVVFLGAYSGLNSTGAGNTAVGYYCMYAGSGTSTGTNNTSVGDTAAYNLTTGSNNTLIGKNAGDTITTGNNNICIGQGSDSSSATASNEITLGNNSNTSLRIPGMQSGATNGEVLTYNSTNGDIELANPIPAGTVIHTVQNTAPSGYLKANGANVSRTTYAALFAVIGTTFGSGDGSTTFGLPDLRGEFIRSWDDGRGVDSGRSINTAQSDELKSHSHSYTYAIARTVSDGGVTGAYAGSTSTGATGGTETRPRNIALLACIKY